MRCGRRQHRFTQFCRSLSLTSVRVESQRSEATRQPFQELYLHVSPHTPRVDSYALAQLELKIHQIGRTCERLRPALRPTHG